MVDILQSGGSGAYIYFRVEHYEIISQKTLIIYYVGEEVTLRNRSP